MSIKFRDALNEQLKDPNFRKEFEAVEPEFFKIRSLIAARKEKTITQNEISELTSIAQTDLSESKP
ncbi:MAG: hypothetical protein ACI4M9_02740 [Succinivibrio sp.]